MREPPIKLLKAYVLQAIEAVSGVDFYEEVVKDIETQKATKIMPVYNELKKQIEDKDYLGKCTIGEQHALGKNEINYRNLLRKMDDSLTHLITHKWAANTRTALWLLDDTRLLIEDVLSSYKLDDTGQAVKAKQLLDLKKFQKSDYIGKIASCQTLLDIIREEVIEGIPNEQLKFSLSASIGKTIVVLQQEIEDREVNKAPELVKFDAPELVVPEIPEEAPEPQMDAQQTKLDLKEEVKK